MKRGDFVWIERDDRKVKAMIVLASDNEDSLMVMFDGLFHGFVGMVPLLRDAAGVYHNLMQNLPVTVTKMRPHER